MDASTHTDEEVASIPDDVEVPEDLLHSEYSHHSDAIYIRVAVFLAVLTGLEVSTYYIDFGPAFLPLLFTLMIIKFFTVVWFFMHLKYDAKLFGRVFWAGLLLAVAVYVGTLATFQVFAR